MSRKQSTEKSSHIRSSAEAALAIESSIAEISALADLYDAGSHFSSRTIATVIQRLISDELPLAGLRRKVALISLSPGTYEGNMLPEYPLVKYLISSTEGGKKAHTAILPKDGSLGQRLLSVSEWESETVFLEGRHEFQQRKEGLSLRDAGKLKRINVSRRELLKCSRNETGAHFDRSITYDYLKLHHSETPFKFGFLNEESGLHEAISDPSIWKREGEYGGATIRTMATEIILSIAVERSDDGSVTIRYLKKD